MNELYYSHPVQVKYWDCGKQQYLGGIGYHDFVICGCCGKVCSIAAILDEAMKYSKIEPDKAIIEMDWIDINKEIIGE